MVCSVREAVHKAAEELAAAKIAGPHREASILVAKILQDQPEILHREPERLLSQNEETAFYGLVRRRANREPMSHITGLREFWSLEFIVGPDVLDPRPDSETVVQAAVDVAKRQNKVTSVLDLGTGSGCLLLSILTEFPAAQGIGIDVSEGAVRIARENANRLGLSDRVKIKTGDWATGISGEFDLVVSNPPYISEAEMTQLQPEVRLYEPHLALKAGMDGLNCYRTITADLDRLLKPGGYAIFEVGSGQSPAVSKLLEEAGLERVTVAKDLAGIERCVVAQKGK
ncbi:MAG: peptide chain release factor N(5)-glutamine methyltransferase [Proteobacteria bacterium]|nr:peptide chain release factor N(5)-glutamine methyltransferase [Pseudomonadota bacterium]